MAGNSPPSPSHSQLPPVPSSPTFSYASTANPLSQYSLPLPPPPRPAHPVLTKADLEQSQTAYADLLASAKAYRLALAALSTAASAFGAALEACARLKEARAEIIHSPPPPPPAAPGADPLIGNNSNPAPATTTTTTAAPAPAANRPGAGESCTADTLLTAAGLHHLVANHQHILSETVYRSFEVPLLHELDKWRAAVEDEEERYTREVSTRSAEIRRLEKDGLKQLQRQGRRRDVARFRAHLVELTARLDGLTALHAMHATTLLRESQDTSLRILDASCSLVRAEVDIFESLARKGWSGGGLEDVLEKGVDLFAAEMDPLLAGTGRGGAGVGDGGGVGGEGPKLFSILPPRSILADTAGPGADQRSHARSDSLLVGVDAENRYQSLVGAVGGRERDRDAESVFSDFNRSRNVRPFSPQPQPLKLNPEDLIGSLEEDAMEPEKGKQQQQNTKLLHGHDRQEDTDEGCPVEDSRGDDNEEEHPWRDEGLRRRTLSGDEEEQERVGASLGDPMHAREESWSVASVNT
ncbi:hypothetical protein N656DRAFT_44670 [Canariomyces notabilis]|uniref:Protein IVY1 n=1 Tax=Canariomyces notabilis TaxID=2074819 RepID=A0AAN6TN51_9PEZI|nr:hypothetical protein N656DRAFT_44670 [Canariomyces arenarius]